MRLGVTSTRYQASSPDEYALILAAKACGYVFQVRYTVERARARGGTDADRVARAL